MFARRQGRHRDWPVIMAGSHLDSVRNGGKFDGPAGVFSAFEAFRVLDRLNIETEHPFELAVLTSEEPNMFGVSTFGSRAMAGLLEKDALACLRDRSGRSFGAALARIGGDLDRISESARGSDEVRYFVELHIEQTPYLDREGIDIGVVSGITGIYREALAITGTASHSGTTPMDKRRDALCGAADIVLTLEAAARAENGAAVATVGRLNVFPNAINITPEVVTLDFEIRSFNPESTIRIITEVNGLVEKEGRKRKLSIERRISYETLPVRFAPEVIAAVKKAADSLGLTRKTLASMAGHDAAHISRLASAGMIFIPCREGLSHCPEEYSSTESIVKGAQCLLDTLLILDKSPREGT
jgi:N-carbamoyl-L-amino-acid hydrolase